MNRKLFVESDEERNAVLHCLSHQIASGSWTDLVYLLIKNRRCGHKLDSKLELSHEQYFLLQINMFLMGVKHLNFFCQIIEKVFVPLTLIESIVLLEKTLNTIVVNMNSIKCEKPAQNIIDLQMDEVHAFMSLKRYRSLSDGEIDTNLSVKFKKLYNSDKKLRKVFEEAPFKKDVEIIKCSDYTALYMMLLEEMVSMEEMVLICWGT